MPRKKKKTAREGRRKTKGKLFDKTPRLGLSKRKTRLMLIKAIDEKLCPSCLLQTASPNRNGGLSCSNCGYSGVFV